MLTNGEDEGIIDDQAHTLGLNDVEIVLLRVRRWMANEEIVWWVRAGVREREC